MHEAAEMNDAGDAQKPRSNDAFLWLEACIEVYQVDVPGPCESGNTRQVEPCGCEVERRDRFSCSCPEKSPRYFVFEPPVHPFPVSVIHNTPETVNLEVSIPGTNHGGDLRGQHVSVEVRTCADCQGKAFCRAPETDTIIDVEDSYP